MITKTVLKRQKKLTIIGSLFLLNKEYIFLCYSTIPLLLLFAVDAKPTKQLSLDGYFIHRYPPNQEMRKCRNIDFN